MKGCAIVEEDSKMQLVAKELEKLSELLKS